MTVHVKVVFTAMALLLPPSSSASCGGGGAGLCLSGKDATSLLQVTRATVARHEAPQTSSDPKFPGHQDFGADSEHLDGEHTQHRLPPQHGKPDEDEQVHTAHVSQADLKISADAKAGPFEHWHKIHSESTAALSEAVLSRSKAISTGAQQKSVAQDAAAAGDAELALGAVEAQADAYKASASTMRTALQKAIAAEAAALEAGKAAAQMQAESAILQGKVPAPTDSEGVQNKNDLATLREASMTKIQAGKEWARLHKFENSLVSKAEELDSKAAEQFVIRLSAEQQGDAKSLEALAREAEAYKLSAEWSKNAVESAMSAEKSALIAGEATQNATLAKIAKETSEAHAKTNFQLNEAAPNMVSDGQTKIMKDAGGIAVSASSGDVDTKTYKWSAKGIKFLADNGYSAFVGNPKAGDKVTEAQIEVMVQAGGIEKAAKDGLVEVE